MTNQKTLAYYSANAQAYAAQTGSVDMSATRVLLTSLLPSGSRILEAGCGSGRDAVAFKEEGFQVTAFDGCPELAAIAAEKLGQPVACQNFLDISYDDEFEGAYACASLLHLNEQELQVALVNLKNALRKGGVLVATFKVGDSYRVDEATGRVFLDMNAELGEQAFKKAGFVFKGFTWDIDRMNRGNGWITLIGEKP